MGKERLLENGAQVALYAFLLFLGFGIRDMFDGPYSDAHRAVVLVGLAAFVGVYLALMRVSEPARATYAGLVLLVAIALALAIDDTAEWAMLFIFAAAAAGFRLPARRAARVIALCAALAAAAGFGRTGYGAAHAAQYVVYTVAIGFMLVGFAQLIRTIDELQRARGELARLAVTEERLRFARDLHDLLGHSLSVIALKAAISAFATCTRTFETPCLFCGSACQSEPSNQFGFMW